MCDLKKIAPLSRDTATILNFRPSVNTAEKRKNHQGSGGEKLRHQTEGPGDVTNSVVIEVVKAEEQGRECLSLHESHFLS